jgi:2-polyprenyl-3-methyl-5-hydroxy-6-metoxy-1,4-benzoquinol methylase
MKLEESLEKRLSSGNYYEKQFLCKDSLIAWSHMSRFKLSRKLIEKFPKGRLLDYGCGDGTFLALAQDLYTSVTGVDSSAIQIKSNQERFQGLGKMNFLVTDDLTEKSSHWGSYDVVTCMEVIEHCVSEDRDRVLDHLGRLLAPKGTLLITVPIEVGPPLMVKQIARALAGLRNLGDYKHRELYSFSEFWKMFFATENTEIQRPKYENQVSPEKTLLFHGHKGFNWRALNKTLTQRFNVKRIVYSPVPFAGGVFNSQAFFICTLKNQK